MPAQKNGLHKETTPINPKVVNESEEVCIRPWKQLTVDSSLTRYPFLGKVGSANGLSVLRYRVAPAVVPQKPDQNTEES